MTAPSDMPRSPRRPNGRGRAAMLVTLALVFVLFTASTEIATFYTDRLWFDSLGLNEVWSGIIGAKWQLVILFTIVLTATLWFNLFMADRRAPILSTFGPGDEVLGRYQDLVDRRAGVVRWAMAFGFGLIGGMNMSGQWQQWLLFRNGTNFGRADATYNEDIGFYVFRLPFLQNLVTWGFAWGCIALLITGVAYYLNGGIRPQSPIDRVSMAAKRHLSLILVFIVLMKTADYWLSRYQLVFSTRSVVHGATYTEVNAELPALQLLLAASIVTAGLIIYSVFSRGFTLPVVSVGGWFIVSLVAGVGYPAFVQATEVRPNTTQKEGPYIANNIAATRDGLGLTRDKIEVKQYDYNDSKAAAATAVEANQATIRNVGIIDSDRVLKSFQNQQGTQNFYKFVNLDVDRYPVRQPDGRVASAAVVVGTRNIVSKDAPEGWENQTIVYTHGYGAALSAASGVGQGGNPDYLMKGIPVSVDPKLDLRGLANSDPGQGATPSTTPAAEAPPFEPAVYFGELEEDKYVIVGANRDELSYVNGAKTEMGRYKGKGGVPLDNFITRAAFSLRFRDTQMLLSNYITNDSRLLFVRDAGKRLQAAAPFITWDGNPYPVVVGGRIVYVVDGYTTTDRFPNAQQVGWERDPTKAKFNYVRNSVKATVDAYDGSVKLYVWDPNDPILQAYARAFPHLFHKVDDMPADILAHVRYPEDLFRVQTREWGRYRLVQPDAFYQLSGAWSVAQRPPDQPQETAGAKTAPAGVQGGAGGQGAAAVNSGGNPIDPNYALLKLPNDTKETFNLMRGFVQVGAGVGGPENGLQNLSGFMFARSDPDSNYGRLVVFEMPTGRQVNGPKLVDSKIVTNQDVSSLLTLLSQQGTQVDWGSMLMVPVDGSIVWVRPMYVTPNAKNNPSAVPVLENVVVVFGDQVVMKPTLRDGLKELFGKDLKVDTYETGGGVGSIVPAATDPNATTTTTSPSGSTSTSTTTTSRTGGSTSTQSTTDPSSTSSTEPGGRGDAPTLIAQAAQLLERAQQAYDRKDLTSYLQLVEQAQQKINEADRLMRQTTTTSTTAPPPPA